MLLPWNRMGLTAMSSAAAGIALTRARGSHSQRTFVQEVYGLLGVLQLQEHDAHLVVDRQVAELGARGVLLGTLDGAESLGRLVAIANPRPTGTCGAKRRRRKLLIGFEHFDVIGDQSHSTILCVSGTAECTHVTRRGKAHMTRVLEECAYA